MKNKGLFSHFPFRGELGVSDYTSKIPRFSPDETAVLWVKALQGFVLKNVQLLIKDLFLLVLSCAAELGGTGCVNLGTELSAYKF